MPTNMPSSVDTFTNPIAGQVLGAAHLALHQDNNDAIEATEQLVLDNNPISGTFSPVAALETPGTSSWTPSLQVGRYTKIANRVWIDVGYEASFTKGTGSGYLYITNLPFTAKNVTQYWAIGPASVIPLYIDDLGVINSYSEFDTNGLYFQYATSTVAGGGGGGTIYATHLAPGPANIYIYTSICFEIET